MFHGQSEPDQKRPHWRAFVTKVMRAILLFGLVLTGFGFEPDRRLTQLIHKSWQTDQGLPQNAVYCLTQDRDGFLWFGTENGLVRFDGVRFEVFTEVSDPAVPQNFTSSLLVAKDGTLWGGTRTGGLFVYRNGKFELPYPELARLKVRALCEASDGSIWVGAITGLFRLQNGVATQLDLPATATSRDVTALRVIPGGGIWVGTRGGDLIRFDGNTPTMDLTADLTPVGSIKALAFDSKTSDLWIARDGGRLDLLRTNSLTTINLLPGRQTVYLETLHLDSEGALWIGTKNHGLICYNNGEISGFGPAEGLPDAEVLSILKDHEGSLWVGTHFGGLNRLLQGKSIDIRPARRIARFDRVMRGAGRSGGLLDRHCGRRSV